MLRSHRRSQWNIEVVKPKKDKNDGNKKNSSMIPISSAASRIRNAVQSSKRTSLMSNSSSPQHRSTSSTMRVTSSLRISSVSSSLSQGSVESNGSGSGGGKVSSTSELEGYLKKRSAGALNRMSHANSWQTRYFILENDKLSYYKVKPKFNSSTKPQKTVDMKLLRGLLIEPTKDSSSGGAVLKLDTEGREWAFECTNVVDVNQWKNAFERYVESNKKEAAVAKANSRQEEEDMVEEEEEDSTGELTEDEEMAAEEEKQEQEERRQEQEKMKVEVEEKEQEQEKEVEKETLSSSFFSSSSGVVKEETERAKRQAELEALRPYKVREEATRSKLSSDGSVEELIERILAFEFAVEREVQTSREKKCVQSEQAPVSESIEIKSTSAPMKQVPPVPTKQVAPVPTVPTKQVPTPITNEEKKEQQKEQPSPSLSSNSSCSADSDDCIKQGWMHKKGASRFGLNNAAWQKRYMRINFQKRELTYSIDPKATKIKGTIHLEEVHDVTLTSQTYVTTSKLSTQDTSSSIIQLTTSARKYELAADNDMETNQWFVTFLKLSNTNVAETFSPTATSDINLDEVDINFLSAGDGDGGGDGTSATGGDVNGSMAGYLLKRPGRGGAWQRRYFQWEEGSPIVTYRSSPSDKKIKGEIDLETCLSVRLSKANSEIRIGLVFELETSKRWWGLAATTDSEMRWYRKIREYIEKLRSKELNGYMPKEIKAGELRGKMYKRGAINSNWQLRYFVLRNGRLEWRKNEKKSSSEATRGIDINIIKSIQREKSKTSKTNKKKSGGGGGGGGGDDGNRTESGENLYVCVVSTSKTLMSRKYYIGSPNQNALQDWMECLKKAMGESRGGKR